MPTACESQIPCVVWDLQKVITNLFLLDIYETLYIKKQKHTRNKELTCPWKHPSPWNLYGKDDSKVYFFLSQIEHKAQIAKFVWFPKFSTLQVYKSSKIKRASISCFPYIRRKIVCRNEYGTAHILTMLFHGIEELNP